MRSFIQYLFSLLLLYVVTFVFVSRFYRVDYPKPPGPRFDPSIRMIYQMEIDKQKPDIVLIGDSLAATNVDPVSLSDQLDKKVYDISNPGSASTLWYLIAKNNIAVAKNKPAYLIILFRDTMLTTPDYRVQGSYLDQIDGFAGADDKLLTQLAFVNKMSWLEKFADQYIPAYGSRTKFRATLDGKLRDFSPQLFLGCNSDCINSALANVFTSNNFLSKVMGDAENSASEFLYTPQNLDFSNQIDRSFLPDIIRICRENNIQLILVRSKTLTFTRHSPAPAGLDKYVAQLANYAKQNNVIFLDFTSNSRLKPDLFADPIHLNDSGRTVFTGLLSQALHLFVR